MSWESNDLYMSRSSDDEDNEEPFLPDWLKDRSEMIFKSSCVQKGQKLGSGQYGSVYKAKLIQGSAV